MIDAAIVGLGRWGQNLVTSVQGRSDVIRFTAGVVRHPDGVRDFAAQHALALHDRIETVLEDPGIDAVVLATPHSVHAEQIIAAASVGKHVFVEKPFALDTRSAVEAARTCADHGVTLAVGFNWRFQPALIEVGRMLSAGELGNLLHLEGNFCGPSVYWYAQEHWRQRPEEGPAGGMTGRGVHVLDAMLYLAGPIERLTARSTRRALDYGLDDTTSMLLEFRSGATATLTTVIATAETWRLQVFGSSGWFEVGGVEHLTTWDARVSLLDPGDLRRRTPPRVLAFPETSTERAELEHFARAAETGRPIVEANGDEVHGVAVLEAIIKSARTGNTETVAAAGDGGRGQ